ncbi:hypothetical protein HDR61_05510 [bacterium]|nr:hypothetical protein [bacterium]MBD5401165.1 hypothetical protein [bacterium]
MDKKEISPNPARRWLIECSEEQLQLIRDSLSDVHQFLRGDPSMQNTSLCTPNNGTFLRPHLHRMRRYIAPELAERFPMPDSYGRPVIYSWSGHDCPIPRQQKKIALSYAIHSAITYNINRFLFPKGDPAYNPRPKTTILSGEPIRCLPGRIKQSKNNTPKTDNSK